MSRDWRGCIESIRDISCKAADVHTDAENAGQIKLLVETAIAILEEDEDARRAGRATWQRQTIHELRAALGLYKVNDRGNLIAGACKKAALKVLDRRAADALPFSGASRGAPMRDTDDDDAEDAAGAASTTSDASSPQSCDTTATGDRGVGAPPPARSAKAEDAIAAMESQIRDLRTEMEDLRTRRPAARAAGRGDAHGDG